MNFSNCQNRFGQGSWSKKDSNYLDVKHKVLKKGDNKELRMLENPTTGEIAFNPFMRLRIQLIIAAENFAREESLPPVLIPTLSKDMDEQLKLAHKVVDVVDWANRKICLTLLRYGEDKPERSYAEVWIKARKKEDEKFQQTAYVNY